LTYATELFLKKYLRTFHNSHLNYVYNLLIILPIDLTDFKG